MVIEQLQLQSGLLQHKQQSELKQGLLDVWRGTDHSIINMHLIVFDYAMDAWSTGMMMFYDKIKEK